MTFVATAIIGSAVIGGVVADRTARRSSGAAERGAEIAASATIENTQAQIAEIRRQYDYQTEVLRPQIEQQYAAQRAYGDLLGIGGGAGTPDANVISRQDEELQRFRLVNDLQNRMMEGNWSTDELMGFQRDINAINNRPFQADLAQGGAPRFPGAGATQFQRGAQGQFQDPNIDPTRLAETSTLPGQVRGSLLAGTSADADPYRNYISGNQIAAATPEQDAMVERARDVTIAGQRAGDRLAPTDLQGDVFRRDVAGRQLAEGAAGTGVYGETFEASPGYDFAVEEAQRASERVGSRGGNVGGRALIEANRRAVGLANQEYYNWAAGRERDLGRLGGAEAADASRLDLTAQNFLARQATDIAREDQFAQYDIGRGDQALAGYEQQRFADVGRGDQAYQNYMGRQQGDVARLDAAASQTDRLQASDQARGDQAYYNYLAQLSQQAGFGNAAAQAVNASQTAGGAVAGAYGQQGGSLASIYNNLGQNQASIQQARGANINDAFRSGIGNFVTYQGGLPPKPQPPSGFQGGMLPAQNFMNNYNTAV